MAMKWFRKHSKKILVVGGALLMVAFLLPQQRGCQGRGSFKDVPLGQAFGKALGTGLHDISLKEISIMNNENGKPIMHLSGRAEKAFKETGGKRIFISLSHERDNALAVGMIEGD